MRILSSKDIIHLAKKTILHKAIAVAVQKAEEKELPERLQLAHEDRTHLIMPAYALAYFSTSLLSVFPGNSRNKIESIQGMVSLNDGETGEPICLLNGRALNGIRSGAVSAFGIAHLAPEESSVLGIVGSGIQGYYQGISILNEHKFDKVLLFDSDLWKAEQMAEKLKQETKVADITVADDTESLVAESDVIVTATNSGEPVLPDDKALLHGKTYIATGSFKPNMTELPKALFFHLNECIVDTKTALKESGDLIEPVINNNLHIDNILTLGQYVNRSKQVNHGKTRLLKTVGLAIHDLHIAHELFELAQKQDAGTIVDF